jgi:hypothetical protein
VVPEVVESQQLEANNLSVNHLPEIKAHHRNLLKESNPDQSAVDKIHPVVPEVQDKEEEVE